MRALGYDIRHAKMGQRPFEDISSILGANAAPVVFDIGANTGQTIAEVQSIFPAANIHAFEPSPRTFTYLKANPAVTLNNFALGSKPGRMTLNENSWSVLTSLLPLGSDGCGSVERRVEVEVSTVDAYCEANGITTIDLLKSDTQGFDLEVLRGAQRMLRERRINLVYIEIIHSKLYENAPRAHDVLAFLADQGFDLVSFYNICLARGRAEWMDALFRLAAR
jgi:FkbM family methyltransferase